MTSTDELERLLAEAQTDEPWTVVWYGDDSLPAIAIHRSTEDRICFMPTIQHPADGVQFEANAALICAAVNALPELLAIRDAAKTALGCLDDPTGGTHVQDMQQAADVLRAALKETKG